MSRTKASIRPVLSAAALLAALSTAGCFPLFKTQKEVYNEQVAHPLAVDADTASLSIPVTKGARGLSAQSERDLRAFIAVYKARGHGPMTIARPMGGANEKDARGVADDVLKLAASTGLDPVNMAPQSYNAAAGDSAAPVLVSFTRYVASSSPCGDWSHNAGSSTRNTEMPDFGCSTQNNFAAMVEDPHDMIAPRAMTAADPERRATVFNKYRKGESTITDRKDDEKADVAKSGGGE